MASTLLVMPQLDIGTSFQILSGESQALRNLDIHFLLILQLYKLDVCYLILPVCVFWIVKSLIM